jgi:hypothetical protein
MALIQILFNNFINNNDQYFILKLERLYLTKYCLINSRLKVMKYLLLGTWFIKCDDIIMKEKTKW